MAYNENIRSLYLVTIKACFFFVRFWIVFEENAASIIMRIVIVDQIDCPALTKYRWSSI